MLPFRRLARWSPAHRTAVAAVAAGPPRQSALLHSSATTPQQVAPSREELKRSPNMCRELLGLPSTFDTKELQQAFHAAALQYHPDTPSKTANAEMFHASKVAHQTLQRVMARQADKDAEARRQALEQNIEHTAPQHREYLTHDGIGYGTPAERSRAAQSRKLDRAVSNMIKHRLSQASIPDADNVTTTISTEIRTKEEEPAKKKKKSLAMFERIAEDQIAAAMRRGEFKNLKGEGKPLNTYRNPHVDPMTARVQGMMQEQGFTPDWVDSQIACRKEQDILRNTLRREWLRFQTTVEEAAQQHCSGESNTPTQTAELPPLAAGEPAGTTGTTPRSTAARGREASAARSRPMNAMLLPSELPTLKEKPGYLLWKHTLDAVEQTVAPLNKRIFNHNLSCPNATAQVHAFSMAREMALLEQSVVDGTLRTMTANTISSDETGNPVGTSAVNNRRGSNVNSSTTISNTAATTAARMHSPSPSEENDRGTNVIAAVVAIAVVFMLYNHTPSPPPSPRAPAEAEGS